MGLPDANAQCTVILLRTEETMLRTKEKLGDRKRQSDAIVVGIMVIVKTADKKIRD